MGKIIFYELDTNMYKWYTIKIEAKAVINTQTVEMKTTIRKAIYVDFTLVNPTDDFVRFDVDYQGEFLIGKNELKLEASKSGVYQLFYEPLKVGNFEGSLHLYNDSIGEFLYKLNLISDESPIVFIPNIRAELGKHADVTLALENPSPMDVDVYYTNNNIINYQSLDATIIIKPYSTKEVIVRYTPSSLNTEESAVFLFQSKIGKWEFKLAGKGINPKTMDSTPVNSYVGGISSGMINFKNPFKETLNIWLELKSTDNEEAFKLMIKKEKFVVDPLSNYI